MQPGLKNVLFIGNRSNVLSHLLNFDDVNLVGIYTLDKSHLANDKKKYKKNIFSIREKDIVVNAINDTDFDILISNGCPFILPISELEDRKKKFINIHPSYLPYLKGKSPINGVIFNHMNFFGATMHFMNDDIDAGNIIHQKKIEMSPDIDLLLLYHLSFQLEGEVFNEGWNILKETDFTFKGFPQQKKGNAFSRNANLMKVDFESMSNGEILRRVKSFGISSQGVSARLANEREIVIYSAEEIINSYLISKFKRQSSNQVILELGSSILLVKSKEGIIKITKYKDL